MKTAGVVSLDASANKLVEQLAEIESNRDASRAGDRDEVPDACWATSKSWQRRSRMR